MRRVCARVPCRRRRLVFREAGTAAKGHRGRRRRMDQRLDAGGFRARHRVRSISGACLSAASLARGEEGQWVDFLLYRESLAVTFVRIQCGRHAWRWHTSSTADCGVGKHMTGVGKHMTGMEMQMLWTDPIPVAWQQLLSSKPPRMLAPGANQNGLLVFSTQFDFRFSGLN